MLRAYGDPEELQPVEPATTITAVFTGQANLNQGTIVGFGGCNSYSADYVVQDDRMIVRPPLSTLAICPVGSDQESTYLALLGEGLEDCRWRFEDLLPGQHAERICPTIVLNALVTAVVDVDDQVVEADEENNVLEVPISVLSLPTCTPTPARFP